MMLDEIQRFHDRRLSGIGASDAPVILGLSSYMSAAELWELKTRRIEPTPSSDEAELGKMLEPVVAKIAAMRLQLRLELDKPPVLSARNRFRRRRGVPWQFAHVDRTYEGIPVELKTAPFGGAAWGVEELGGAGIPPAYRAQIQHQIAVLDVPKAWCCVLIAGHDPRLYEVERNDEQIAALDTAEGEFWQHVLDDEPVAVDGSESSQRYLRRRHPFDDGSTVIATAEQRLLANSVFAANETKKAAERAYDDVKARMQQLMGDAAVLVGPGFEFSYRAYEKRTIAWEQIAGAYRSVLAEARKDLEEGADEVALDGLRAVDFDAIEGLYTRVDKVRRFVPTRKEGRTE